MAGKAFTILQITILQGLEESRLQLPIERQIAGGHDVPHPQRDSPTSAHTVVLGATWGPWMLPVSQLLNSTLLFGNVARKAKPGFTQPHRAASQGRQPATRADAGLAPFPMRRSGG